MKNEQKNKFCKFCGAQIPFDAVLCTSCGRQVEDLNSGNSHGTSPQIVINNANANNNVNSNPVNSTTKCCNKWISFALCLFLGFFGAHKFYEENIGLGILYLFTAGLFCIGWMVDIIIILCKPNPYYVNH